MGSHARHKCLKSARPKAVLRDSRTTNELRGGPIGVHVDTKNASLMRLVECGSHLLAQLRRFGCHLYPEPLANWTPSRTRKGSSLNLSEVCRRMPASRSVWPPNGSMSSPEAAS